MSDREAQLASMIIALTGSPADGSNELAYASMFARRLAELLHPAEVVVLFCPDAGCPAVAAGSSERTASLVRLASDGTAGPATDCCRTGHAVRHVPFTAPATPWPQFAAAARAARFGSAAVLPMSSQDETIGAVTVLTAPGHALDAASLTLAELLAEAAAISVCRQRSLARSLRTARQLQQALDTRVVIEQAKGSVAARLDITTGEAFELLRGYSRRNSRLLSEVAGDVLRGALPANDLAVPGRAPGRAAAGRRAAR